MSCSVCAGHDSSNCPCCGETIQMIICPDCYGTGMKKPRAFHIHRRLTVEVTETTWQILPKDEDDAAERGENWCRFPREACPTCKGEGEVPENYKGCKV